MSGAIAGVLTAAHGPVRRGVLRSVLDDRGIPHAWEGTVVVVPAEFEETLDEIVEEVASTARRALGTVRETLAYDVSPWSAGAQNSLVDQLVEAHIPHEWDSEGHLVVHEEDSEAVGELLDALGEPDGGDEISGLELNERLSALFVFVDRLSNDPADRKARKRLPKASAAIRRVATPFGVEPASWLELHDSISRLQDLINASDSGEAGNYSSDEDPDGDSSDQAAPTNVEDAARVVRDLLRRFV
ncbi:MAG: hypothetical protein R2789_11610 [Microthrixaceae bacterium]